MSDESHAEKDPSEWETNDEPATEDQKAELRKAGETVPDGLTKAEASQLVDQLQHRTE